MYEKYGITKDEDKHIAGLESLVYSVADGQMKQYDWIMKNMYVGQVAKFMILKIRMTPNRST